MKIEDKDIKRVVPPLRFPEFRDAEGWEEESVEAVLDNQSSQIALKNIEFVQKGYPVYGADGSVGLTHDYSLSKDYISIVKDGSGVGRLMLRKRKSSILSTLNSLTSKDETTYKLNWLYYLMQTINLSSYVKGSGIPHIYYADYKKHLIYVPKPAEQTKIANCLSSLDDLISAVTDKIETLKEYKKGLMQQLFPAEGKTTPALRFPEFQNAGEWKNTVLEKEVHYENGKAHENDIDEAGHYIVVNSKFISTDGKVVKYTNHPCCLAEKNDILMVLSDVPNGRAIAKCFIVDCNTKYTVNQRICKLKSKQAVSLLLYYIINRNPFLLAFDDGIKQTNLKKDEVLNLQFRLPKDPKEQQTIANFLSSVDELISAETDKLDQLKTHKKGLMQQLFPTINK